MTNAELIAALRYCGNYQDCSECPLRGKSSSACFQIMLDAADALEADEKRIAELSLDNKMLKNTIDADKGVMLDRIRFLEARLPKWISVEDRLPENDDEVIVAYKGTYEPKIRVSTDCYNPRAGRWDLDHHHYTHWMPLPYAPKGERE